MMQAEAYLQGKKDALKEVESELVNVYERVAVMPAEKQAQRMVDDLITHMYHQKTAIIEGGN